MSAKMIYEAFGLRIMSEMVFCELTQVNGLDAQIDIEICYGDVPQISEQLPYDIVVQKNEAIFYVPNTARFSIQKGKKIVVTPLNNFKEDVTRLYILGTCMGTILMQRKIYPLHGSAVVIGGKAYAIVGETGAGKSTLATVFTQDGFKLLSDDIIAISPSDNNVFLVKPSYPQQKLWEKSLYDFGMDPMSYSSLFEREKKYAIPIHDSFINEALPLAGIFELEKIEGKLIKHRPIVGTEKLKSLCTHTYRNFLIPQLGLSEWHFKNSSKIINQVDMYKLQRPSSGFSAYQLAMTILDIAEGGISNDQYSKYLVK